MKRSRFTEEQIIGILKEQEAGGGNGGRLPPARHFECHFLQMEGQVRRPRSVGSPAAEGAGG